jgi:hypothetical protein
MRDCTALVQSSASKVEYLGVARMGHFKVKCEVPEQDFNNFSCWEVRAEFLDSIKPHELKKVRQSRNTAAQKYFIYLSLA